MTIVIVGKGPTLTSRISERNPDSIYVALNTALKLFDFKADYHVMNDFENLVKMGKSILNNSHNLIIPTFPHINEKANIEYTASRFMKIMPYYSGKVHQYNLHTAPIKNKEIEFLDVKYSVAETATLFFINRGYRDFEYIGVGTNIGYTKLLGESVPNHQNTKWLTENHNRVVSHLTKNNCNYLFK